MADTLASAPIDPVDLLSQIQFQAFPAFMTPYVGAVVWETFLYGVYAVLFTICTYVLLSRHKALHWVLLFFALSMFAVASADVSYTHYLFFTQLLRGHITFRKLYPKYVLFVTNNLLADSLLMYRCFIVWGRRKRVIAGPILLLIATAVCGYLFEGADANLFKHAWVYLSMTFALNIILTVLTAGRIWHLARTAESAIDQSLLKRYNTTLAILIESGLLLSSYIILDLAFQNHDVASVILDAGLIQIAGIMPTLIIVQVGLGRAVHNVEAQEAQARIETNRRSLASDAARSLHDAKSFREAIRSHRSLSSTTTSADLEFGVNSGARSFRSSRSQGRSGYPDANGSRKTLYDMSLDTYTLPNVSKSLPPSPVLLRSEKAHTLGEGQGYQSFPDVIHLTRTRESYRSGETYFEAI